MYRSHENESNWCELQTSEVKNQDDVSEETLKPYYITDAILTG
jgi:hypothetical protein